MPSNISSPRYLPVLVVSLSLLILKNAEGRAKRAYLRPRARGPNSFVHPKLKMVILFSPVTLKVRNGFCCSSASERLVEIFTEFK